MPIPEPRLEGSILSSFDMINKEDNGSNRATIEGNLNVEDIWQSYWLFQIRKECLGALV